MNCVLLLQQVSVWMDQCDQIGRFFKVHGDKKIHNSSPNDWQLLGLFWITSLLCKYCWIFFLANLWENFGYFLLRHLVTLEWTFILILFDHCSPIRGRRNRRKRFLSSEERLPTTDHSRQSSWARFGQNLHHLASAHSKRYPRLLSHAGTYLWSFVFKDDSHQESML